MGAGTFAAAGGRDGPRRAAAFLGTGRAPEPYYSLADCPAIDDDDDVKEEKKQGAGGRGAGRAEETKEEAAGGSLARYPR